MLLFLVYSSVRCINDIRSFSFSFICLSLLSWFSLLFKRQIFLELVGFISSNSCIDDTSLFSFQSRFVCWASCVGNFAHTNEYNWESERKKKWHWLHICREICTRTSDLVSISSIFFLSSFALFLVVASYPCSGYFSWNCRTRRPNQYRKHTTLLVLLFGDLKVTEIKSKQLILHKNSKSHQKKTTKNCVRFQCIRLIFTGKIDRFYFQMYFRL